MPTSPTVRIGTTLAGRYHIQSLAAEEMLGNVYVAEDSQGGGLVQVKVLSGGPADDPERFARFGREITATWMVAHPNTVEVLDWGQEDDTHYLVLEYVVAHPLQDELDALDGAPMPVERVAHIAAQIAGAVGAAHQEGIVHRALSPATVLLLDNAVEGDFVKVRDFGMSKLEEPTEEDQYLTQSGRRVGEHAYMSPEYIQSGAFHTKGDLYALGALMFHLLTGRPPFVAEGAGILMKHVQEDPGRPSELCSEVPEWMDELVLSMLRKKPGERPGAYKVVQRLQAGVGATLEPPQLIALDSRGQLVEQPSKGTAGPGRWALAAAAALVIGGGLTALVVVVGAGVALVITLGMM